MYYWYELITQRNNIYIYTHIYPSYNISYIFHTKYFYVYIYIYVLFQHIPWAHIFIATHLTGIPWTPRNVTQLTMISTLKEMSKNCEAVKLKNWRFIGVYLVVDIPLWQIWVSQLGQLGLLFPIYIYIWKMKNVPNHQPGKLKEQVHNPTAMCCCSSLLWCV